MADLLKFKHGLQANMKESSPALAPGTVYITRDERAMYVDLPAYDKDGVTEVAKRIRIGDMRTYEYLDDLKTDLANDMSALTTSALYYAEKDNATSNTVINALLKWNGTEFIQLNKTSDIAGSLTALAARVTTVENTVSGHTTTLENHETRIDTLEDTVSKLDETYATDTALTNAVNTLNAAIAKKADQTALDTLSQTVANNKSAADTAIETLTTNLSTEVSRAQKAEEANATAIEENAADIETNTKAIATLNGSNTTAGSVAKQVKDAVDAEATARASAITTLDGKITNINTEITGIKSKNDSQDTEINKKVNIAQGTANSGAVMIVDNSGNVTPGAQVSDKLTYLSNVTSDIQEQFTGVNNSITATNNTVAGLSTRMDSAEADIAENAGLISDNAEAIATIQEDLEALKGTGSGSVAEQIAAAVKAEEDARKAADETHSSDISTLKNQVSALQTADETFATDYVKKTDAPGYGDILTKTSASSTYATKTELNTAKTTLIGAESDATTADTIWAAKNMATAASNAASAAKTTADSGVSKANAAQTAIDNYIASNDAALAAEIARAQKAETANADAIADLEEAHGTDKAALEAAIAAEKTRAEGVESDHAERIERIEVFFESAEPGASEQLVDTLKELQEYIASDTSGATTMAANIQQNTTDISGLKTRMTTAEGNITTLQGGLASEITNRETAVTNAIETAEAYTDSALEWGTF